MADPADPAAWHNLTRLAGSGAEVAVAGPIPDEHPGGSWPAKSPRAARRRLPADRTGPRRRALGAADVPEILDLIARTQPRPFRARTVELGTYLGIRSGGALVAMADERLRPPGWTEISAVCTDPAHRGQGLATRLVRAVAGIRARGEIPFLHTSTRGLRPARLHPGPRADPATDRTTRRRSGPSRSPPTRTTSPWSGDTESTDPIDRLSGEQAETARVRVV